jgi:hypothetical protein
LIGTERGNCARNESIEFPLSRLEHREILLLETPDEPPHDQVPEWDVDREIVPGGARRVCQFIGDWFFSPPARLRVEVVPSDGFFQPRDDAGHVDLRPCLNPLCSHIRHSFQTAIDESAITADDPPPRHKKRLFLTIILTIVYRTLFKLL